MKTIVIVFIIVLSQMIFACDACNSSDPSKTGPVKVEVKQVDGRFMLYRDGAPYYIHAAGGGSPDKIARLAERGGNSLRTWSTRNADKILDQAQKHGLTVLMGLNVASERHGFDYNDSTAVKKQLERIREEIEKYKDHPALLGWGIGNELNLRYTNPKVWNAVNDIARMIHDVDGNHPATTMLAGINKTEVDHIKANCPNLDFLCIQMYGDIINLNERVRQAGWEGPFAITEWGATGHWEVARTSWNVAIEQTSSEKAASIMERWHGAIAADTVQCLGSYVFLWGQKQERTPTWYGLFLETGEETEAIDVLQKMWTGQWPQNRAPSVDSVLLDGKTRYQNVSLYAGREYELNFRTADPDNDPLTIDIEVLYESTDLGDGGDHESRPEAVNDLIKKINKNSVQFRSPAEKGAYRIFLYIRDGHNHAATANVPFFVN